RLALGDDKRPLAAMGFLTLGRRFLNNVHDIIDDRIDVVTRGLLGLTVACARCHDHKFDPIPTTDYYSLYGVFASSVEPKDLPLIGKPEQTAALAAFEKGLHEREARVAAFLEASHAELLPRFRARVGDYLLGVREREQRAPGARTPAAGDLSRALLARWRAYLAAAGKAHDPVFAPWHAFAALPPGEFAARAEAVAARIAANRDPGRP